MTYALPAEFDQYEIIQNDADFPIIVTASGTTHTKGSWVEFDASAAFDVQAISLKWGKNTKSSDFLYDIGTGAASSETVHVANINGGSYRAGTEGVTHFIPVDIASGTRIALRIQAAVASLAMQVEFAFICGGDSSTARTAVSYGTDTADSKGVSMPTNTNWTELTSSLANDIDAVAFTLGADGDASLSNADHRIDIGTGAAASETLEREGDRWRTSTGDYYLSVYPMLWLFGVDISSGTRVAVRRGTGSNASQGLDAAFIGLTKVSGAVDLVVADLTSTSSLDAVTLTQVHQLTVADLTSSTALEAVVLTQDHVLALEDLVSASTLDAVTLTQAHNLTVADMLSGSPFDNVVLTQDHQLVVADMASASNVENVVLNVATNLIVADLNSASTVDAVVLTQVHNLTVSDMLSESPLETVALTQDHQLVVADLNSATAFDAITLVPDTLLTVEGLTSASTLEGVVLTQAHNLSVENLLSATTFDNIDLAQVHELVVDSLLSGSTVDNVTITVGLIQTPEGRVYVIAAEDRTLIVPAEDRSYVIPEENP